MMENQSNKLSWNEQVKLNEKKEFILLYATLKVRENKLANKVTDHTPKNGKQCSNNKITTLNNILNLQGKSMANNNINIYISQGLKTSSIPYKNY